jgi:hypothetical protein
MRDNHIIKLIEERALDSLSESEHTLIAIHIAECVQCKRSYEAACISAVLIKERVSQTVEPSPFFKTRVMAAIREKHLATEPPAIVRMWKAAGAMVSAMVMIVVVLAGLSYFESYNPQQPEVATNLSIYSPESVVLEEDSFNDESDLYDVVLANVYDAEDVNGDQ